MSDTDWREILSYSQRDLKKADKDKLCESLSWMEADDIDLNFTDLKTLFKLAQDILKYKAEQVNNLMGQLETTQRKLSKKKSKATHAESPKSTDSVLETIAHQEEMIKANKEILEQLQTDIEELERKKGKLEDEESLADRESESSRDALSEMDAVVQLEKEVVLKNRHIRKLLGDVKVLEEENTDLKAKVSVLKDKLTEATQLIENFTEQLFAINNENIKLKEMLGSLEKTKAQLSDEIQALRKELFNKEHNKENIYEDIKAKVQHWKDVARSKKSEVEALLLENRTLKEDLSKMSKESVSPKSKQKNIEQLKMAELQEKLTEASNEIIRSADIIESLKSENQELKNALEDVPDISMSDVRNESDEGKERIIINKLKRRNKNLTDALKSAEETVTVREKELAEITAQLQLLKSDEGIEQLLEGLKNKKRQLQLKDDGIKTLVKEVNDLSQSIDDLQLQNEAMRQKLNIPADETIPTKGFLKKYRELEQHSEHLVKNLRKLENKLVGAQLENRDLNEKIGKFNKFLNQMGYNAEKIDEIIYTYKDDEKPLEVNVMPQDGGGESSYVLLKRDKEKSGTSVKDMQKQMHELAEENEGLRKGLQEILDFLKDNSSTSSGVLALECPSLEAMLQAMEARHAAGWFAPHMSTIMALKSALGSKDALLTALHEARKETFDVMARLSRESQKSLELEQRLKQMDTKTKASEELDNDIPEISIGEYGSWIAENEQIHIDFSNKNNIKSIVEKGNKLYENRLKSALVYFHNKLKILFDKMTLLAMKAADDKRQWLDQEGIYKQEIENLKAQIDAEDHDNSSDVSPGIMNSPDLNFLHRRCSYLEESYKYIRTLNENIKNECLEIKKDAMIAASDYESQIQNLVLSVANLTDRLRDSISLKLFWKQNAALHEITMKYRKLAEEYFKTEKDCNNIFRLLENNKLEILSHFQMQFMTDDVQKDESNFKTIMTNIEQSIYTKQLEKLCTELENRRKQIDILQTKLSEIQENQSKLIDKTMSSLTKEDTDLMKEQLDRLSVENKLIKEQCQHVGNQLDVALIQLQDSQQRRLNNDMEINMLRHQVLDLQSSGDNKAIVARLSGEVLVAHLQASESHKKIERLSSALNKEKELRAQAEEMLSARQKIFDVYASRHELKFRYMFEAMEVLRQEYQGSLPLTSLENYLNNLEEVFRKNVEVNEKLNDIEDLRCSLMTKHTVFDQILDVTKNKCLDEYDGCAHKLKNIVMQKGHSREIEHCNQKIKSLENSYHELLKHCNKLEKTLLHVNQGFNKSSLSEIIERRPSVEEDLNLKLEDIQSDDESTSSSGSGKTVTLSKPNVLKDPKSNADMTAQIVSTPKSELTPISKQLRPEVTSVTIQTTPVLKNVVNKILQTDDSGETEKMKREIISLKSELAKKNKEVSETMNIVYQRTQEVLGLSTEKIKFESSLQSLKDSNDHKDNVIKNLRTTVEGLKSKIEEYNSSKIAEINNREEAVENDKESLLNALKQLESEKNAIVNDYKELLNKERQEFTQTIKELQNKLMELKTESDRKGSTDSATASNEPAKSYIDKYTLKISELENKCFSTQSELDECKSELTTYQSELERWKSLASERLVKMEQLNSQLEERHNSEVETYKAENDHWLSQLNESQKEHMELRTRLSEQKSFYLKQLAEKDSHIEQLRSVNNQLKTQIMNMQTMISINDPSFDLSAIVEVDETTSDGLSQPGSGRLELKFDSLVDLEAQDDVVRFSSSTTAIWQEPIIERLRREKQLTNKQNALLRRQIKALAARERRARLDAQNLKNQMFRISTNGSKVPTAETAALQNRIATLQAQLMSARRENASSVALWDKWKRAQQASERWQARFEEKCREVTKLQSTLQLSKSSISRLEKEKRVLLSRLNELKGDKISSKEETQDDEASEKSTSPREFKFSHGFEPNRDLERDHDRSGRLRDRDSSPPVSSRALLDRVEAQQRRIVALEAAEKGNEFLVSEYEKALAEVTSLKGQVLKLESTLLESQIKCPPKSPHDSEPELDYWKRYCEMLKEENVQLNLKLNAIESTPMAAGANQHRIHDLEQTVLTLRGLVNKLQAEQKSSSRKTDSRPGSGRSFTDKTLYVNKESRSQLESYRTEIANLKRTIQDKDLLLERSKEMLKIAAEREDELLRENASLHSQIIDLQRSKEGFMSA